MTDDDVAVGSVSADVAAMVTAADMPRALMGGTPAMRAAGEKYLPKEAAESDKAYSARLKRSTLFGAFSKTVEDMTGKVFAKPIVLGDDVPAEIKVDAENIDLAGRHLNVFARDVLMDAMVSGIGFIVVDMPPPVARSDGVPVTRADEQAAGLRPYLVYLPLESVLGWKSTLIAGVDTLTMFRFKETVVVPDGRFAEKAITQVRVLEPGKWSTYRKAANSDKWVLHEEGVSTLPEVAVVPVYVKRTGFMVGSPPLAKLAELNVEHWQSASDQRNILHVARVPILFGAGFNEDTVIEVGASRMVRTSEAGATLEYVEHTGAAIEAGRNDLKDLEFRMQAMGLQLLVPDPGQSATGEIRDDAKENSPLAMIARSLGDAIEAAFGLMAKFRKIGGDDAGGSVDVNTDFGVSLGATDVQDILSAYNADLIDAATALAELKRRGFLSDSADIEAIMDAVALAAPKLDAGSGKGMDLNGPPARTA